MSYQQIAIDKIGSWGIPSLIALLGLIASIAASIISSKSSSIVKRLEIDAAKIQDLENRISDKKYNVYRPMIDLLRKMLDQEIVEASEFKGKISEFSAWIIIFGSDEGVKAFHNFMQAAYNNAPPVVLMRFYADFVISARRDMGYPETAIHQGHFLGMRISDVYTATEFKVLHKPLDEIYSSVNWSPPWREEVPR